MITSESASSRASILMGQLGKSTRPLVMGVLNITPDSFSDGGKYNSPEKALEEAKRMVAEGVDILDIGGESTRPGADKVTIEEELKRTIPVIKHLSKELNTPVSVDTSKAAVMKAAVDAGAVMINDINALRSPGALEAALESNVIVCLMHMSGSPQTMQTKPQYDDVVSDIIVFLRERANDCVKAGIDPQKLLVDPGFGFGKTMTQNFRVLNELTRFGTLGFPVLAGLSRKSMIGDLLDIPVAQRMSASVVLATLAAERGAAIIRVHDVKETLQAMRLVEAVTN
jgi:dihydropteroate synthase